MSKRNKIIYWIATIWLALGMLSTGLVQIFTPQSETGFTKDMTYPIYFIMLLGVWKILGVIAILVPKFALLKEWAYAGFFFVMTGAIYSHLATNNATEIFPALLLLALTIISWSLRPADRKIVSASR